MAGEVHPPTSDSYHRSLTRNIVLIIVVVSVTPLLLISGTIGYYFDVSYHTKALEYLQVLVKKHRQNIDNFLYEKLADIGLLAKLYTFDQFTDEAFLKDRLTLLQEQYGRCFVDLGVVNDQGLQIAYAGPFRLKNADYSKAEWFKQAMQSEAYISDVFHGLRGLPHFIVTARQEYRGKKWILRATVDFEQFNSLVQNIRIGSTGFAFILNKKGEFQTKPRFEVEPSKEPYVDFLKYDSTPLDEVAVSEKADDKGVQIIHVWSRLKNADWLLAYQQKASDAFSVLNKAQKLTIVIFLIGVAGIIIAAVLLAKRLVRHIAKMEMEKEMMNEQVIEAGKLASIGELAAGIAHEINNPVAVMVEEAGWIRDLLDEEDLKETSNLEEFKRSLNQIRTQGQRCKEITHKLLSFARKTDPTLRLVQINELIEDVIGLSQQRALYANVKIETSLASDLPKVEASPSELQQVLLNMINNSLDAMDSKGGKIEVISRVSGDFVVVDVADTGVGIPKSNLQRIFDPFFTTKPVGKGTGLGLSICYGIMKKMGGDLTVNSAVGLGTTFHIHIPMPRRETGGEMLPEGV
jgi:two-component system, NtrC family, sensor kinase